MAEKDILLTQNVSAVSTDYAEKFVNFSKGSILSADVAKTPTILGVGADGDVLVSDAAEATGLKWTKQLTLDSILLNTAYVPVSEPEGLIWWNSADHALNAATGLGTVAQLGQEDLILVYNNTGAILEDGKVVQIGGGATAGGYPYAEYAQADVFENCDRIIGVVTSTIGIGAFGFATTRGKVRGIDTTLIPGPLFLSPTTAGDLTNVQPAFPDYVIEIGGTSIVDAVNGEITVSIHGAPHDTVQNFWNGCFRESFDFTVDSALGVVTGSLEPSNGHDDMTMMFSDGFTMLDTSPAATIVLTPGTDSVPVTNYVYIPKSTKVLTVSTSDWPTTVEHIKVSTVVLRSAATTETDGALRNQNWNDHVQSTTSDQGHLSHVTEKLRQFQAQWFSGTEATMTIDTVPIPDTVNIAVTSGVVYQLHRQAFPAIDTAVGGDLHIVNNFANPFVTVTDLNTQTLDANGVTLNNRAFAFVLWGIANKTGQASHLMVNLPSGSYAYNSLDLAESDPFNFSVYNIPSQFNGTGFLIARFIMRYKNDEWELYSTEDLRGTVPNISAGGGAGGGVGATTFLALTDVPASYIGEGLKNVRVNSAETALEFSSDVYADTISEWTLNAGITFNNWLSFSDEVDIRDTGAKAIYLDNTLSTARIGRLAGNDAATGYYGIYIGVQAGSSMTTGSYNTFIGFQTGLNVEGGLRNLAIGANALKTNVGGNNNVAIGASALQNIAGADNVALGFQAGYYATSGGGNTFLGVDAGRGDGVTAPTGGSNIFAGYRAGFGYTTANYNIAFGRESQRNLTTGQYNVSFGYLALRDVVDGQQNIAIGGFAGQEVNSGYYNVLIGGEAGMYGQAIDNSIFIGYQAGKGVTGTTTGDSNAFIGYQSGYVYTTATFNVGVGHQTLVDLTTGSNNTVIGYRAGYNILDGSYNTAIGSTALFTASSISNSTAVGFAAGYSYQGTYGLFIGNYSGENVTTGNYVTNIGYQAGQWNGGAYSLFIGYQAGRGATPESTGSSNIGIGGLSLFALTDGIYNVGVGRQTLYETTVGGYNIAIGTFAGRYGTSIDRAIYIGYQAGEGVTGVSSGDDNTFIGYQSGKRYTTGGDNIGIGTFTLTYLTDQGSNIAIGSEAGYYTTNYGNILIGTNAGKGALGTNTGYDNIFVGLSSGFDITEGFRNVGIGNYSLTNLTSGDYNFGIGAYTLTGVTTASQNIAIGAFAGRYNPNTGNVFIGYSAGNHVSAAGSGNVFIGRSAGSTATTAQYNVLIGYNVQLTTATDDYVVKIGFGTSTIIEGSGAVGSEYLASPFEFRVDNINEYTGAAGITLGSAVTMTALPSDDTEDHVIAIDDTTGVLSKRSVASIGGGVSWGTATNKYLVFGSTPGDVESSSDLLWNSTLKSVKMTNTTGSLTIGQTTATTSWITATNSLTLKGTQIGIGDQSVGGAGELVKIGSTVYAGTITLTVQDALGSPTFQVYETGATYIYSLGSDDTEDHVVAIDDVTGLLTKRSVSSLGAMVYPGAGIAVSTGSAWGTSITDNSTNWNTAYTHSQLTTGNPHSVAMSDLGYTVATTVGSPGSDTTLVSEQGIREAITAITGSTQYQVPISNGSGGFGYSQYFTYDYSSSAQLTIGGPDNTCIIINAGSASNDTCVKYSQAGTVVAVAGWDDSNGNFGINVGSGFGVTVNDFQVSSSGHSYFRVKATIGTSYAGIYDSPYNQLTIASNTIGSAAYISLGGYRTGDGQGVGGIMFHNFDSTYTDKRLAQILGVSDDDSASSGGLWFYAWNTTPAPVKSYQMHWDDHIWYIDGTEELYLDEFSLRPFTANALTLGTSSVQWDEIYCNISSSAVSTIIYLGANGKFQTNSSDVTLKENIRTWDYDSIGFLNSLDVRIYDRKDGSNKGEIGWIAQEVQALMPEMVYRGKDNIMGIKEPYFWSHLHKAFKDHYVITKSHEQEIEELKKRVEELENQLEN
jgi:hypothetical protein